MSLTPKAANRPSPFMLAPLHGLLHHVRAHISGLPLHLRQLHKQVQMPVRCWPRREVTVLSCEKRGRSGNATYAYATEVGASEAQANSLQDSREGQLAGTSRQFFYLFWRHLRHHLLRHLYAENRQTGGSGAAVQSCKLCCSQQGLPVRSLLKMCYLRSSSLAKTSCGSCLARSAQWQLRASVGQYPNDYSHCDQSNTRNNVPAVSSALQKLLAANQC
jgi:hypothetical protein